MSSSADTRQREEKDEKSKPVFTRRAWTGSGSVDVAVFERTVEDRDNEREFRLFNIVAKRSWKNDKGYQSSNSFFPEDLLPLALFLQEAYTFVASEQSKR